MVFILYFIIFLISLFFYNVNVCLYYVHYLIIPINKMFFLEINRSSQGKSIRLKLTFG